MTSPPVDAEAVLLARVRDRATRDDAFDEIFTTLRERVFAICLHVTGNAADADDALQDTFLSVHTRLSRFRGDSRLFKWVYRIAIRAAIRVRSRRRVAADVHDADPASRGPDPVIAHELGRRVAEAMDRLPADHRVVTSLFAVDGLTHAEVAEILVVPEGTVWSRLHAARKRLAAELGDSAR